MFYQNAGASCDLSLPVLERTLFHCTNCYFIPNVSATAYSCKTNLPPNTAFRGFGGPQGMFVIESAIAHAAEKLGVSPSEIQRKNLIADGDEFPYGQIAESEAAVGEVLAIRKVFVVWTLTRSIGIEKMRAATCAIFVLTPCPISTAPVETATEPSV